ncbi:T9SS type A sorting domain-containing protein [Chryseobacterium sp. SNU WT5]|uniref:T9SS type A sorting domain-containing protein n=1 Tax=Chryseobacterium sp. SNU WT5 TaxID=2594269 RepID=UPI00117CBF42|nr:T9SS type A sorting domain-containing protein [Chryseobacterium sp. SNU WT5]QDP85247.1 T9SS type A sorting domain-containing protein [Chryseobacterium sp. SNU WT5]
MKNIYLGFFAFFGVGVFSAQQVVWQKDFATASQDFLSQVSTSPDGQLLISGSSIQSSTPGSAGKSVTNAGFDYHVVKLNQQGRVNWEKYFSGDKHDYLAATAPTTEGGFLLAGTSYSSYGKDKKEQSFGGSDIWLIKINEEGEEEWQKTIGTSKNEVAKAVIQSRDLGYFIAGDISGASAGFGEQDAIILKLDKSGKLISQLIFGGAGTDEVQDIISTNDGGVLVGLYSRSGQSFLSAANSDFTEKSSAVKAVAKSTDNYGEGDYWVVKFSKEGAIQWQKNLGGKDDDRLKTLSVFEHGFLIGGESHSSRSGNKQTSNKEGVDLWFVALNEDGEELWQKSYSLGNKDVLMSQNMLSEAGGQKTKGFLIGGYTKADQRIKQDEETFWMLYLDANGDEVWRKHIEGKSKNQEERLVDVKLQNDGSYILAGTSTPEIGQEAWKIMKLADKEVERLMEQQELKIYPNPVEDYCYVEIGLNFTKDAEITLHDMSGRQLQMITTKNKVTKMNTQNLIQGAYLVTIKTDTNKTANSKLIKK